MDIVPSEPLAREIAEMEPAQLASMLIEGKEEKPGLLAKALNESGYELPPLPNLFFTRDSCIPVGQHVLIGSMRYGIRWPEELIIKRSSCITRISRAAACCTTGRSSDATSTRSRGATST